MVSISASEPISPASRAVFFERLLAMFPVIEQAGDAVRIRSNLNNGLKRFPVRLGTSP